MGLSAGDLDRVAGDGSERDGEGEQARRARTARGRGRFARRSRSASRASPTRRPARRSDWRAITGFENCQASSRTMSRTRAPNTLRIPISLVRRSAVKAARPNRPRQAISDREQGEAGEGLRRAPRRSIELAPAGRRRTRPRTARSGASRFQTRSTLARGRLRDRRIRSGRRGCGRCRCRGRSSARPARGPSGSANPRRPRRWSPAAADLLGRWLALTCLPIAAAGVGEAHLLRRQLVDDDVDARLRERCARPASAVLRASSRRWSPLSLANRRDSLRPASSRMPIVSKKSGCDAVPADRDRARLAGHLRPAC